jgi:hypothetical protein
VVNFPFADAAPADIKEDAAAADIKEDAAAAVLS